jgi:cell division protein FtsB
MGGDPRKVGAEMNPPSTMKRKVLSTLLIGLILLVWYFALFGEKGVFKIIRLKRERDRIIADVNRMQEENKRLQEEIRRLREDSRYLESVARRDLGLIKENEILFIFEDKEAAKEDKKDQRIDPKD